MHISPLASQRARAHRDDDAGGTAIAIAEQASTNSEMITRRRNSFAGSAVNVQFIVKDSKKYVESGGWGFADFTGGKPGNDALHAKCFSRHLPAKDRDYVFTRYAPTP